MHATLKKTQATLEADRLLTREQAAEFLGVTSGTLAVWASVGRYGLKFKKVGRSVRYKLSDLQEWLDSRTRTATA